MSNSLALWSIQRHCRTKTFSNLDHPNLSNLITRNEMFLQTTNAILDLTNMLY